MKLGGPLLVAVVAACALAAPAQASQPTKDPVQIPDTFTIDGICTFPVQLHVLVNREVITTFASGVSHVTGSVKVRLTNLDHPARSITLNISGPARFVPLADGRVRQTGVGLGLQPFPAESSITGHAEFLAFSGPEVLDFYPDGSFKEVQRGHVRLDVCSALG